MKKMIRRISIVIAILVTIQICSVNISAGTVNHNPEGCIDRIESTSNGQIRVKGWAFDRDDLKRNLIIHVWVGGDWNSGVPAHFIIANRYRSDVNAVYPGVGYYHGFDVTLNVDRIGKQTIYVYAENVGTGSNTFLGKKTINILGNHNPVGYIDRIESNSAGTVRVKGWAADYDQLASCLKIHVWIGGDWNSGVLGNVLTANLYRPDVDDVYVGFGKNHGFDSTLTTDKTGNQPVYIYAVNVGTGENTFLGKKTIYIQKAASAYDKKVQAFTKNSTWKNNAIWNSSKRPTLNNYGATGCCAYAADFAQYVFGVKGFGNRIFYNPRDIRDGDVIHVTGSSHWIVVLYRNGNKLTTAEGNWGGKVVINESKYTVSGNTFCKDGLKFRTFTTSYHLK